MSSGNIYFSKDKLFTNRSDDEKYSSISKYRPKEKLGGGDITTAGFVRAAVGRRAVLFKKMIVAKKKDKKKICCCVGGKVYGCQLIIPSTDIDFAKWQETIRTMARFTVSSNIRQQNTKAKQSNGVNERDDGKFRQDFFESGCVFLV